MDYARAHGNGAAMSASNPVKIEMLVDYVIPSGDKVTLNQSTDNIVITTAATSGGVYNFTPTFDSTQGREPYVAEVRDGNGNVTTPESGDRNDIAIIRRASDNNDHFFYITGSNVTASITTERITFDGANMLCSIDGGFIYHAEGAKGTVRICSDTTMRNSKVNGSYGGGAIASTSDYQGHFYIDNAAGSAVRFINCTATTNGGAVRLYNATVNITNNGILTFEDCSAKEGGAIKTHSSGSTITITTNENAVTSFESCIATDGSGGAKALPKLKRLMVKRGLIPDTYEPKKHKHGIGADCRETVITSGTEQ